MRRSTRISLTLAFLAIFLMLMSGAELWAKGGRGGGKGRKGGGNYSTNRGGTFRGGRDSRPTKTNSHGGNRRFDDRTRQPTSSRSLKNRDATNGKWSDSDQPWSKHQAREQRKLDHRKRVTNHLREMSDRNGNERLKQVADDMDKRAYEHYDKQMQKPSRNTDSTTRPPIRWKTQPMLRLTAMPPAS